MHWSGGAASRLRHAWTRVLPVLALGLFFAAPALATSLPPTPNPLPGSSFQGADGNQDDAAPLADWQALHAAGRVGHGADANDEDSAFTGGSKEDEPGSWDFETVAGGVTPDKANILDTWTATEESGVDAFAYLAFARAGTGGGTTYLTFELNHDARVWWNGYATIPCRRTGDVLLSYNFEGSDVDVVLQEWTTSATDLKTGCATTGHLSTLTGLTANVDAQGAMNAAAITSRLPGHYQGTVPSERFGEAALNLSRILDDALGDRCFAFGSVWMHSRASTSESSGMQDYVAPRAISLHSCSASGTKFHDLNGNGRHDAGEPGLPRWLIWADYDDDGVRDRIEPFGITDGDGGYVVNDIRPRDGSYMLRETVTTRAARRRASAADVSCSFPNASTQGGTGSAPGGLFRCAWGPIASASNAFARGRDFGNYQPAQLIIRKELEPSSDPGRFNLLVNGVVKITAAGDGASRPLNVPPGPYTVSEVAAPGTNLSDYDPTVDCKKGTSRTRTRAGPVYANLQLNSRELWTCTFLNIRRGAPAIAIDKTGRATATAGDTLRYTLYITNPGDLAFRAASVHVTDPNCDQPPAQVGKADAAGSDDSPGTLDPGDTWTYACSKKTTASADCTPSVVPNIGTVSGVAGGRTVSDISRIQTILGCPPQPKPPKPQPPNPGPQPPPAPPSPIVPPGPNPPDADDAAVAGGIKRLQMQDCVPGGVRRVQFAGTRVARVQISINGQVRRSQTLGTTRSLLSTRVALRPGATYKLRVQVTFQRGTGSPPVQLTTTIRACASRRPAARPSFTG